VFDYQPAMPSIEVCRRKRFKPNKTSINGEKIGDLTEINDWGRLKIQNSDPSRLGVV